MLWGFFLKAGGLKLRFPIYGAEEMDEPYISKSFKPKKCVNYA